MTEEDRALLAKAAGYLVVPYRLHGAGVGGWDCLGMVRTLRHELFGLSTPYGVGFYSRQDADDYERRGALFDDGVKAWARCEPVPGAVALFNILGRPAHVGLLLTRRIFIHARDESTGTVIEDMAGSWARRLVGYFDAGR
ncbi:NlpC/P60 family protein [Caulobacter sp. Root343]|uniref:NlpC/P60 family protein n=1 Tax=Caulobacter sp. Root343 TaxID=1736520 RepID=UPI0006F411A8|nr:NlpC/P60 family protein [Caulobacter sp. Root343]KQV66645.1 hypothetical protein ASC70_12490 [Caulobacter sp. Root343]